MLSQNLCHKVNKSRTKERLVAHRTKDTNREAVFFNMSTSKKETGSFKNLSVFLLFLYIRCEEERFGDFLKGDFHSFTNINFSPIKRSTTVEIYNAARSAILYEMIETQLPFGKKSNKKCVRL